MFLYARILKIIYICWSMFFQASHQIELAWKKFIFLGKMFLLQVLREIQKPTNVFDSIFPSTCQKLEERAYCSNRPGIIGWNAREIARERE